MGICHRGLHNHMGGIGGLCPVVVDQASSAFEKGVILQQREVLLTKQFSFPPTISASKTIQLRTAYENCEDKGTLFVASKR